MMNKKGYTFIEVLITLTITLSIAYGVITVPTMVMKEYRDFQDLTSSINDGNVIRTSLTTDIQGGKIVAIDANTLTIGQKVYRFSEEGLKRDNNGDVSTLSDEIYFYTLDGEMLHIYNDTNSFKYATSSSFDRGELNE